MSKKKKKDPRKRNLKERSNGVWYFIRQYNSKPYEFSLNTSTLRLAMELRDRYNIQLRDQGYIDLAVNDETPLLGDVVIAWYKAKEKTIRNSTLRTYKEVVRNHLLKAPYTSKPINAITFEEIEDWANDLKLCGNSVGKILTILSNIFKYAKRRHLVSSNPVKMVERPKTLRGKPDVFTPDEVETIIANAPERDKPFIEFRFYTGLRSSELVGLRYGDIDFHTRKVHIQRAVVYGVVGPTKNETSNRVITLNDRAYSALMKHIQGVKVIDPEGYVFLNKWGNMMSNDTFNRWGWQLALRKAGVRYRPSRLSRHTYITLALLAKERIEYVARYVGHTDTTMIQKVYQGYISDEDDGKKFGAIHEDLGQTWGKPLKGGEVINIQSSERTG